VNNILTLVLWRFNSICSWNKKNTRIYQSS